MSLYQSLMVEQRLFLHAEVGSASYMVVEVWFENYQSERVNELENSTGHEWKGLPFGEQVRTQRQACRLVREREECHYRNQSDRDLERLKKKI